MKLASAAAAFAAIIFAAPVYAQAAYKRELPDSLKSHAKIAEDVAAKTALAKVPGGAIDAVELERENGKLIYSYDIKVAGKKGVEEVNVDAVTGKFISKQHEDPETEKKEAADEAKAKAKAASAKPKKP